MTRWLTLPLAHEPDPRYGQTHRLSQPTPRHAEFLAFIHAYTKIHRSPPAEHELCSRLSLTPPSVHDAIMRMEKAGLIARTPRQPRSITILAPERDIPPFEDGAR